MSTTFRYSAASLPSAAELSVTLDRLIEEGFTARYSTAELFPQRNRDNDRVDLVTEYLHAAALALPWVMDIFGDVPRASACDPYEQRAAWHTAMSAVLRGSRCTTRYRRAMMDQYRAELRDSALMTQSDS